MLHTELIRPLSELLREHAERRGDKIAFRDRRRSVTYAELERRTGRLAGHLAGLHLQPGDRALIYLGNCVEALESYLAITRADGVGVPFNPQSADAELAYVVDDSGARVVITDPAHLDQVRGLLPGRPYLRVVVTGEERLPWHTTSAVVSYEDLVEREPEQPARDEQGLDDVAWMLYTSGTTGRPKGVLSTQRSCLWSVAACYAPIVGLSEGDNVLWPLPLHHSLAHVLCVVGVTAVGASARILDGFAADEVLRALGEEPFTFLAGVPAMYHYLLDAAHELGPQRSALTRCLTAGSVCPAELRRSFEDTFGVPLLDGYGSTETCGLIAVNWPSGGRVEGSCGLPVPGLAVRLVDPDTGEDVDAGREGEVWVRGPNLMAGYHNQPEATAAALPGGWYRTGDLARRDELGYLTITGRIKELIIRSGENIHPGEVEEVLRQVPGVADAAVVAKPHQVLGEVPVAFVVPGPGGIDPERIYAACRERLANFKVPEELYEIDEVPRTSSGKVTRHVLLERPARLRAAVGGQHQSLLRLDWAPLPSVRATATPAPLHWALLGPEAAGLAAGLVAAGATVATYPDAAALHEALAAGEPAPEVAVLCRQAAGTRAGQLTDLARSRLDELAELLRTWVGDDWLTGTRLVVATRGAVAADGAEEVPDLAHAPLWGLVRSAQAEHPDRFTLLDLDEHRDSARALPAALASGEPALAVRAGIALAPRLKRVSASADRDEVLRLAPSGTVLVSGTAGGPLARHLVAAYGARHVLLVTRGGRTDGATAGLAGELTGLGARVAVAACDVADRTELVALLAKLKRPLTAVVHAPDPDEPFRRAAEGALNLHRASSGADLAAFVLVGSVVGALGMAGAAEQAATGAFLDGLARHRRGRGLPALSMAVGSAVPSFPGGTGLPAREASAMFDVACSADLPQAVVLNVDSAALRGQVAVPALLRDLIDVATRATAPDERDRAALRARLAGMSAREQQEHLLELVRAQTEDLLGGERADARRTFKELGLTSVTAVELRNRLVAETGLPLSAPVVFDHPTPLALARYLRAELLGERQSPGSAPRSPSVLDEPIAIVGMACRFPGGVGSPEELWRLVAEGRDAVSAFPTDRGWDLERLFDPTPGRLDTSVTRQGGFLTGAAEFDAEFFGISPREALAMDPQQRLLLEVSWEAVERAGIAPTSLRGANGGVFAGLMYHDYGSGLTGVPEGTAGYWTTGTAGSVASGRVAYALGLEGPAVTVDTACSSSLVALHLAAQSLRQGECDLALAGGVTVMSTPETFVEFSRQGGMAPDGRCKAFSAAADGAGWSEGVGVLVLERLSDARCNGHRVLALVRGSAVNQDGASNGLTAPNGPSQQRVIRQALANAGLVAADVDAVEAHGTGTTLGDPIEAQALLATYGQDRDRPLLLGSVKSNLGHTQAAAGVAGVIKMVMAMRHGVLPRTLHVDEPSPHVDWSAGAVELLTSAVEWPEADRPRRAGVSSFGISGTNAHVVLEQPLERPADGPPQPRPAVVPWLVSAKSPAALEVQLDRFRAPVDGRSPFDVGYSLLTTRALFDHRAVLLATGEGVSELARGAAREQSLAVLFSGQGSQRLGMGRELYERFPVFAQALDEVLAHLDPAVREVMWGADPRRLDRTGFAQPALFALEVALYRLVESFGITPDYVGGHSIGEVVAAHVAGVLPLKDACVLVSARARLMQALPPGGAMVAVQASEEEVLPHLVERVSIAAVNGPRSVVVAGDEDAVARVVARLGDRKTRRLLVSHAFHSPSMDPMLEEFRAVVEGLAFAEPRIPVVSNLTGQVTTGEQLCAPEYWVRHVRDAVRFADGVRALAERGATAFLELGPDGVLCGMAAESLPDDTLVVPVLRRDRPEEVTAVTALAQLHVSGVPVDWGAFFADTGARPVDLPTYPFQHKRFWAESARSAAPADPVDAEFWSLVEEGDLRSLGLDAEVAASVAPALTSWRERRRALSKVDSWRFRESWTPLPPTPARPLAGPWLAVVPAGSQDARVAAVLAALGPDAVRLDVPPTDDRDLLAARLAQHRGAAGVVSLLGLAQSGSATPAGVALTVLLVQALADVGITAPLWAVTCGAVAVDGADRVTSPDQTALWGLGRVAALELPRRWGGLVDLPEVVDAHAAERLVAVLTGTTGEDQVAVRPAGAFGRRLVAAPRGRLTGEWTTSGTALVTGGTGGLGAHAARWLASRGAQHVVLVSRRGPAAPGAAELRADLEAAGTRVTIEACDVTDRAALAAVLSRIPADRPLRTVVHAAGVDTGDGPLESLPPERLDALFHAKATSARHLHELTRDAGLDAFVLFSSGAATWGSGGQPAYSAANAFLDGLAQHRRAEGLPATSIAWGAWAGSGMAADPDKDQRLRRHGVLPMDSRLATTALQHALADDETALTVADVDWERFASGFTAERHSPLLAEIPLAHQDSAAEPDLAQRLAVLPAADRERALLDLVRAEAAAVLGHDQADAINPDKAFREQGFDSLTGVEMRNRLRAATGLALHSGLVFDHPTPRAVARHLAEGLAPAEQPGPGSVRDELDRLEAALASAPEVGGEDVRERLEKILARLRDPAPSPVGRVSDEEIKTVSVDQLMDIIDQELFDHS